MEDNGACKSAETYLLRMMAEGMLAREVESSLGLS